MGGNEEESAAAAAAAAAAHAFNAGGGGAGPSLPLGLHLHPHLHQLHPAAALGGAQSERGSDGSGELLPDLGSLRCASSSMAEHSLRGLLLAQPVPAGTQVGGAGGCGLEGRERGVRGREGGVMQRWWRRWW